MAGEGRVAFVVESSTFGGAEKYVAHLLRGLPQRFSGVLVAAPGLPEELSATAEEVGAPIVVTETVRNKFDLVRLARQTRSIRSTSSILVHLNLATVVHSRHTLASTALLNMPTVATLHLVTPILSGVQRRMLRHFLRRLPLVIAVSAETRDQLRRDLGVDESAIRVVKNGVDIRNPLALGDRIPVRIGAVGRLASQKGFDLLIEAVRVLVDRNVEVEAVLVGEGPDRAKLERLAAGLPVTFTGFTPAVDEVLDRLDVFCLPSRWEGLPFALLEAMMAGLPCVAASVGDVPEALDSAGLLVPPDDLEALVTSLGELALSAERRCALGAAAHRRALERFSVERMVAETVAVYDEVLAR